MLDTNLLITAVVEKVDIFSQIMQDFQGRKELIVLKDSLEELKKLEKRGVKGAKLALENVLKQKFSLLDVEGVSDVDTKLLNIAVKQNAFIATNDKFLRKRAKSKGLSTLVYNKSKKRIMVV